MRTRNRFLASLWLLPLLVAACDRPSRSSAPSSDGTALESPRSDDRDKSSLVFSGQLRSVDPDRMALIVAFADDLYEFAYTDATEVDRSHEKRARPHRQQGRSDHGALPAEPAHVNEDGCENRAPVMQ